MFQPNKCQLAGVLIWVSSSVDDKYCCSTIAWDIAVALCMPMYPSITSHHFCWAVHQPHAGLLGGKQGSTCCQRESCFGYYCIVQSAFTADDKSWACTWLDLDPELDCPFIVSNHSPSSSCVIWLHTRITQKLHVGCRVVWIVEYRGDAYPA